MSFAPGSPGLYGQVFPQDALTGALGVPWVADEAVTPTQSSTATTPVYAVENGATGPTDLNVRDPPSLSVTFRCSNSMSITHPRPDFVGPERAMKMALAFQALYETEGLVALLVPGFPLLRSRTIGTVTTAPSQDLEEILITADFARVDLVTLQTSPPVQDADLCALGSQITSGGTL